MNFCLPFWQLINWGNMPDSKKRFLLTYRNDSDEDGSSEREFIFENLTDEKYGNMTKIINTIENATFSKKVMLLRNVEELAPQGNQVVYSRDDFLRVDLFDQSTRDMVKVNATDNNTMLIELVSTEQHIYRCFYFKPHGKWGRNLDYFGLRAQSAKNTGTRGAQGAIYRLYYKHNALDPPRKVGPAEVSLCPSGQYCSWIFTAFRMIDLSGTRPVALTYREYRSKLLPPPFATGCRDYASQGLSKESCYTKCMSKFDDEPKFYPNCSRQCREKQCTTVQIIPHTISYSQGLQEVIDSMSGIQKGWKLITVLAPLTPVISAKTMVQFGLSQFLTDVGSSIGFWLGLSAIGATQFVMNTIVKYFHRLQMRKTTKTAQSVSITRQPKRQALHELTQSRHNQDIIQMKRDLQLVLHFVRSEYYVLKRSQNELKCYIDVLMRHNRRYRSGTQENYE